MTVRQFPPVFTPVSPAQLVGALLAHIGRGSDANEALSQFLSGRNVTLVDSGTSALTLAIRLARLATANKHGQVALPAYCCPDIGTAAIANGMRVSLYDIDPHTLAPDWASVENCLRKGAEVLVLSHFFGWIANPAEAFGLAKRYGAQIVEDAAQGAGASWEGRPAGTLAPLSVLSFGRGKGINAGGGGALVYDHTNPQIERIIGQYQSLLTTQPYGLVNSLADLAKAVAAQILSSPYFYAIPATLPILGLGETVYRAPRSIRSLSRTASALLPQALVDQRQVAADRRAAATFYRTHLAEVPGLLLTEPHPKCISGALREPIQLTPDVAHPLRRLGVARSYPRTLDEYGEIGPWIASRPELPGARYLANGLHTLPTHGLLKARERLDLIDSLRKASIRSGT